MNTKTFNPTLRRRSRRLALQALYQWQVTQNSAGAILAQFAQDPEITKTDRVYFEEVLANVVSMQAKIDEQLTPFLSRPLAELDPIELTILRIGMYELLERPEIPCRVIMNEAIELAKTFGGTDGHKFVNGALDKAARVLRPVEMKSA